MMTDTLPASPGKIVAKRAKKKGSRKAASPGAIERARAVAAGLEASFTDPAPAGAMAPAPLLDEIRELGEAGFAGMLDHLSATAPEGRAAALASLRALGEAAVVPRLLSHARSLRWAPKDLASLGETIRALDPEAKLPPEFGEGVLGRAQEVADRVGEGASLSREGVNALADLLLSLPPRLREVSLREGFGDGGEAASGGARPANLLALAEAMGERGADPPACLIDALAALETAEAGRMLSALADSVRDKGAASRVRKALYRLRSRGILAEERKEEREEADPRAPGTKPDFVHAMITAVDGRGDMLVWLARSRQPRGRYLVQARIRRMSGVEDCSAVDLGAKEMRDILARIAGQPSLATVEAPPGYAFWLLQRAQRESEVRGTSLPAGFTRAKLLIEALAEPGAYPPEGPHPVRAAVPAPAAGAPRAEPKELFSHKAFWSWVIEEERIAPHFRTFVDSLQSQVALDETQRRERLDQIVAQSAGELYAEGALRERIAGQLEDNAYFLHLEGRDDLARECVALAGEMETEEAPPRFFAEMVEFTLSVTLDRLLRQSRAAQPAAGGEPTGEEDDPVIVTP